ncbi:S8 family serine peptidase [Deinococcus irradiatisoli]|nr:S8 family serine peptidase [Deinococcus irradiatisoli]
MQALPAGKIDTPRLTAQGDVRDMKMAEISGRIGAWAKGRIGAWAKGQEINATTRPDGLPSTFAENLPSWQSIHLAEAQNLAPHLGQGVVVAVIDTGIDPAHPMLQGHLSAPGSWYDFANGDTNPTEVPTLSNGAYGHGTAVASVILQVAPNATILPIRALDSDGYGSSINIAKAVTWAILQGAKVINISAVSNVDTTLTTVLNLAATKGVYVTLAAGNEAVDKMPYPAINASKSGDFGLRAINVGAVGGDSKMASFSNYGRDLEITAPGVDLVAAVPGGYAVASGTSFSAPVLAGTLALALGERQNLLFMGKLANQIDLMGTDISKLNPAYKADTLGNGLLNAQAFLKSVQ